jgi:hypothetical protein
MEKNEKDEYDEIKEKYEKLVGKYNLPSFEELNFNFDISKSECDCETILRDVRKIMVSRFASWLNFIELLLNPSNGSMFHLFLVKGINGSEKQILDKLFEQIGEIEIEAFALEINYSEKNEADFIRDNFKKWIDMKEDLEIVVGSLKKNWKKVTGKKEKSYYG